MLALGSLVLATCVLCVRLGLGGGNAARPLPERAASAGLFGVVHRQRWGESGWERGVLSRLAMDERVLALCVCVPAACVCVVLDGDGGDLAADRRCVCVAVGVRVRGVERLRQRREGRCSDGTAAEE